jgi:hypothetical protein
VFGIREEGDKMGSVINVPLPELNESLKLEYRCTKCGLIKKFSVNDLKRYFKGAFDSRWICRCGNSEYELDEGPKQAKLTY